MFEYFSKRARLERAWRRARVRYSGAQRRYTTYKEALERGPFMSMLESDALAQYAREMGAAEMELQVLREQLRDSKEKNATSNPRIYSFLIALVVLGVDAFALSRPPHGWVDLPVSIGLAIMLLLAWFNRPWKRGDTSPR